MKRSKCLALLSLFLMFASCKPEVAAKDIQTKTEEVNVEEKSSSNNETINYVCAKEDSVRIENFLREQNKSLNVLTVARSFIGKPYVAATLEGNDPEKLVVNLRELDCTTLVETVLALVKTKLKGGRSFMDYCKTLEQFRYRDGKMNGYVSRLHYFDWWLRDNVRRGNVYEVSDSRLCTANYRVNNSYMSEHPDKYPLLRKHPEWVEPLRRLENKGNSQTFCYLPKKHTNLSHAELSFIEDGDVIAIVTNKRGLDYSHLGFAAWGKDGKLHLLNASSIHHKVVEEPKTLFKYLNEHPSFLGIRVLRLGKKK